MGLKFRRARSTGHQSSVLGTYHFTTRTVQVLLTDDDRIQWTCDCESFQRQSGHREPLWCKHIAKAAARRSLERFTRRVSIPKGV